ncbi:hypothetical protein Tco_0641340 [Tanacetum coccineum]
MPRRDCSDGVLLLQEFDFKVIDTKGARLAGGRSSVQFLEKPRLLVARHEALEDFYQLAQWTPGDIMVQKPHSQKDLWTRFSGPPSYKIATGVCLDLAYKHPIVVYSLTACVWKGMPSSDRLEHKALMALMQANLDPDCPDCEDSQFVIHQEFHILSFNLGIPISYRLTFYLLAYLINGLRINVNTLSKHPRTMFSSSLG